MLPTDANVGQRDRVAAGEGGALVSGDGHGLPPIIGESPAIRRARHLIERYAPSRLPILIVGATGTGKELVAAHPRAEPAPGAVRRRQLRRAPGRDGRGTL